jgi:anti-anti-sigma factor
MTNEQTEIPPATTNDERFAVPTRVLGEEPACRTSLESERFGLLAAPKKEASDFDRRMENWIASNLDLEEAAGSTPHSPWIRLIDGLPGLKRRHQQKKLEQGAETALLGWARFHVVYKGRITVVRLSDKALVRESQIRELACDLIDLIEAGNHRVVLNFSVVERLASWVVLVVGEAQRRCESADGGALKICGLPQQLASIFPTMGFNLKNALHVDEASAIDSPWPASSSPRTLPIEILSAITSVAGLPPIRGGAPSDAAEFSTPSAPKIPASFTVPRARAESRIKDELVLDVQVGSSKSRSVAVTSTTFVIGRDRECDLRLGSVMVSKRHAVIERRDHCILLHDLGSTNGTVLNGRLLRNQERVVKHGDRIQIGPIIATLSVGPRRAETTRVDEMVSGWLQSEGSFARSCEHDSRATEPFPACDEAVSEPDHRIKYEVIQGVLVITPQVSDLVDDEAIELFRSRLHDLYEQNAPRHVVVNLECVRHLNAKAIGMLLAHHLRLDRSGGAIRICQAHARLMAVLHGVRLTEIVECQPTLDEAVLAAWPGTTSRLSAED